MRKQRHHIITRAYCKRYGVEQDNPLNLMEVDAMRHYAHHRCLPKLSVHDVPPESVAWIEGLGMGWYLARFYDDYELKEAA